MYYNTDNRRNYGSNCNKKKETDTTYVLGRNIILAVLSFVMGCVGFFLSDPSYIGVFIISTSCYLLSVLMIALGIKDYKFNKRINRLSSAALCKHYSKLVICNAEESTISIKDIQKIKSRRYIKTFFGLSHYISDEGILKITTKDKTYKLENVEDVKTIHRLLNKWTKKTQKTKTKRTIEIK